MTAVSTQSGMSTDTSRRLWRETPAQLEPALRGAQVVLQPLRTPEQVGAGGRLGDLLEARDRAAVEDPATLLARARADVDDPVRAADDVEVVLDDEEGVAGRLQPVQHVEQGLGVGRVQTRRRLVEDVGDAEEPGAQLGRDPQALCLTRRQGRRAATEAEVAQAEVEEHLDAGDQVRADPHRDLVGLLRQLRDGTQQRHDRREGQRVDLGDRVAGEGDRERLRPEAAAVALGARRVLDETEGTLAHPLALGVGQDVHDVLASAPELPVVAVVDPIALGLDQDRRLLVGEEQPVAVLLLQAAPGLVDVDPEPGDDAAQVGALPRARPRRDRAVADAQRAVRDQQLLGDVVHDPQAVAARARTGDGVGGEGLRGEVVGARRVVARSRVEDPEQVGQRGDGADRRARRRRAATLLERHSGRQPGDLPDVRRTDLLEQPAGVRRDRLEVAALRLGVQRAEGERRLPGARHPGEGDHGVAGDVDIHVAEVVLAGAAHVHEVVGRVDGHALPVPPRVSGHQRSGALVV